jgi:hypothetical protein
VARRGRRQLRRHGQADCAAQGGTFEFLPGPALGSTLAVTFSSDLDTNPAYAWKGIAAGDLDGDGIDELVATRSVGDGAGTTVLAYKWIGTGFRLIATSTFGNSGNSDWTAIPVGDFNRDGRAAVAVAKNNHSNFAVLDLPPTASPLRVLATSDLDSAPGQNWRGVTAVDWLGGDQDATELVAVRAAKDPYRADLFVYGNPFHRVQRDTGLEGSRSEYDQARNVSPADLIASLAEAHATTIQLEPGDPASEGCTGERDLPGRLRRAGRLPDRIEERVCRRQAAPRAGHDRPQRKRPSQSAFELHVALTDWG